jgi:DNA modification methylase
MKYIRKRSTHWFILSPRPRERVIIPSKYPEELVKFFLNEFKIKENDWVLDPFVGIGSTNLACAEMNCKCVGIDIQPIYVEFGEKRLKEWCEQNNKPRKQLENYLIVGDSSNIKEELKDWFENKKMKVPKFKMCITSPSYWKILETPKKEFIEKCKKLQIPPKYYKKPGDIARIKNYDDYIDKLVDIFNQIYDFMEKGSFLVVILKNIKNPEENKEPPVLRLAWDFAMKLLEKTKWKFFDEYIWCQDDVPLQPLNQWIAWSSTICHHYCLVFERRE